MVEAACALSRKKHESATQDKCLQRLHGHKNRSKHAASGARACREARKHLPPLQTAAAACCASIGISCKAYVYGSRSLLSGRLCCESGASERCFCLSRAAAETARLRSLALSDMSSSRHEVPDMLSSPAGT
eukprot:6193888-Pleurochrysis_carterae.AAC.4